MKLLFTTAFLLVLLKSLSQNVGIGVAVPSAKLEIRSLSALNYPSLLIFDDHSANYSRISFQNSGGPKFWTIAGFSHNLNNALSKLNFYNSAYGDVLTLTGDGKVGVGLEPVEKLDVAGSINLSGTLKLNNNAGISGQVLTSNGSVASWQNIPFSWVTTGNNIYNNNSGSVGVGTNAPISKVDIRHTSTFLSPTLLLYDNAANNYSRLQFQNASGPKFWNIAGLLDNLNDANSRLNFYSSEVGDVMSLTGDGKVGIGIVPAEKLDVNGNINLSGALKINDNAGQAGQVLTSNGTGSSWQHIPAALNSWNVAGNNIYNNNSGFIGIGTALPQGKLDIRHSSTSASPTLNLYDENPANFSRLQFQNASGAKFWNIAGFIDNANDANSRMNFYHSVSGDILSISGNGRIGVGITSPTARFHIKSASALLLPQLQLEESNNDYTRLSFTSTSKSTSWTLAGLATSTAANDRFNIYHSIAGDVITTTGSGRVGIGNNSPAEKLDVNGTANINGQLKINGNAGTSGQVLVSNGGASPAWQSVANPQIGFNCAINPVSVPDAPAPWMPITSFTEIFDDGNVFNSGTGFFVAPANGVYQIQGYIAISSPVTGSSQAQPYIRLIFTDNIGSEIHAAAGTFISKTATYPSFHNSFTIKLNAGDSIGLRVYQFSGGPLSIFRGSFSGFKIY